jgi:hypothetical protein
MNPELLEYKAIMLTSQLRRVPLFDTLNSVRENYCQSAQRNSFVGILH